jgi:hypothetical protein
MPTDGHPQGCHELIPQAWCEEFLGCEWIGEAETGECSGHPTGPTECERIDNPAVCREEGVCDWYGPGPLEGGFCDDVSVCDEFETHGLCIERGACDWVGEVDGYCRPTEAVPTDCSDFGFLECREASGCEWVGGDWGECQDER